MCHPELVSGSYQPSDSTPDWSDSEHRPIIAKQQSLTLQNDYLTCHPESTSRHSERSKDSVQKLTKCQVLDGGSLREIQSISVAYSDLNKKILARDVGEVTSRTYRDTRKGTVVALPQNDEKM